MRGQERCIIEEHAVVAILVIVYCDFHRRDDDENATTVIAILCPGHHQGSDEDGGGDGRKGRGTNAALSGNRNDDNPHRGIIHRTGIGMVGAGDDGRAQVCRAIPSHWTCFSLVGLRSSPSFFATTVAVRTSPPIGNDPTTNNINMAGRLINGSLVRRMMMPRLALLCLLFILPSRANCQGDNGQEGLTRIIGGSEAVKDRFPYAVLLLSTSSFKCGGSLIARDVVLTAAHCKPAAEYAYVGEQDIGDDAEKGIPLAVKEIVPHPNFSQMLNSKFGMIDNDFMLVFLGRASNADHVVPIELNSDPAMPSVGQNVTVMGWGDTDIRPGDAYQVTSEVLLNVDLTVISNEECDASEGYLSDGTYSTYNGRITANMLCTWTDGKDSCQGDSGGPLVIKGDDAATDVQVGVVSWGFDCASDQFPGVYARVSQAYDWIQNEVCNRSSYASEAGFDCNSNAEGGGSLVTPVADNPCIICPKGVTANDGVDFRPYADIDGRWDFIKDYVASLFGFGDVRTCSTLIEAATQYQPGTEWCALHEMHEVHCCPTVPEHPCALCPNGATAGDGFVPEYQGNTLTCKDLINDAENHEMESDYCGYIGKTVESYCCPSNPSPTQSPTDYSEVTWSTAENPCIICPDGATAEDDYRPYASDGDDSTCGELINSAKSYETESIWCGLRELDAVECCPTPPVDPCIICPTGAMFQEEFVPRQSTGSTMTCKEKKDFASLFESGSQFCKLTKSDESLCCPEYNASTDESGAASAFGLVGFVFVSMVFTTYAVTL
ncbi:hypothetical protein ACHAXA_005457 [Cyclostephanos tholiformis]|uniref:Peptidase S1 domain-containing protein n=1 Tax=Cyclostephanos tholiformis TaxID=382380 RepID=A0ABD3SHE0_9STRA